MQKVLLPLIAILFFATSFYEIEDLAQNKTEKFSPIQSQEKVLTIKPTSTATYAEEIYSTRFRKYQPITF